MPDFTQNLQKQTNRRFQQRNIWAQTIILLKLPNFIQIAPKCRAQKEKQQINSSEANEINKIFSLTAIMHRDSIR